MKHRRKEKWTNIRVLQLILAVALVIAAMIIMFWDYISPLLIPRQQVPKPFVPLPTAVATIAPSTSPSPTRRADVVLTIAPEETPEPTPTPVPVMLERFEELYALNDQLVGWVTVPNTNVDYAVLQSGDNSYYLDHNFYKKKDAQGYPFLDIGGDILNNRRNLVMHGHALRNNMMFTTIKRYNQLSFYRENPTFTFDTIYQQNTYKIIAMMIINADPNDGDVFYFPQNDFADETEFLEFVKQVRRRSLINTTVDVMEGDELAMLSTCTYEINDARFVLVGRKLRAGEDPAVDVAAAEKNENVQMPEAYYEKHGGVMPTFEDE